ncbi:hypothetical protein [Thalassobacillus sp. C254]|uniref:hypothetical protein n=1 Tax=Thalassobacillus sp. C254 TaxID=1225341 RepID=UPI0012EE0635|nr:hypothetical protein [Thalassobacillus sp. C254]
MMKKKWLTFGLSALVLLTACGDNSSEETAAEERESEETSSFQVSETGSETGSIGDGKEVFDENYGEPTQEGDTLTSYQDDYILVSFLEGIANSVTAQFEMTDEPRRTESEVLEELSGMIPEDAVKVDAYEEPDYFRKVLVYQSDLVADSFEKLEDYDPFREEEAGTFILILEGEPEDDSYFGALIAPGHHP